MAGGYKLVIEQKWWGYSAYERGRKLQEEVFHVWGMYRSGCRTSTAAARWASTIWPTLRFVFIYLFIISKDTICLDKGSTYSFQINDAYQDGLTSGEEGFYSLTLDGKEIARGADYGSQTTKTITTENTPTKAPTPKPSKEPTKKPIATKAPTPNPTKKPTEKPTGKPTPKPSAAPMKRGPCTNRPNWELNNVDGQTCDAIFGGNIESTTRNQRCNEKDPVRQRRIKHFCPSYCRRKCRANANSKTNEIKVLTLDGKMVKAQMMKKNINRSRNHNMNRKRNRKRTSKRQVKTEFISRM